jgi:hypothetical protein
MTQEAHLGIGDTPNEDDEGADHADDADADDDDVGQGLRERMDISDFGAIFCRVRLFCSEKTANPFCSKTIL